VGEMNAFIDGIQFASADLEWYDNYLGGVGGKYKSWIDRAGKPALSKIG